MFYDQASIFVKGGRGGDGAVSFRREAFVPMGGPDGGNGGRGADVVLVVNRHLNTLNFFQHKREFFAPDGRRGGGQNKTGRSGKTLYVEVPPGTVVRDADTNVMIGDLTHAMQQLVVAKGGKGGRGNQTYATAQNQAPRMAENGAPGEYRELHLELKLIADIGFVGLPNAGKSTLLASLTAAKPKIANYPFTTLQPNLGVAQLDVRRTVVLADIPGLIEGAAQGVGLGHEFLRHIERTRVLIHLIDGLSEDPIKDYETIQNELANFGHGLIEKPQLVAMTKMDLPDAQAALEILNEELKLKQAEMGAAAFLNSPISSLQSLFSISAATGKGVRELLRSAVEILDSLPPAEESELLPELTLDDETEKLAFEITREADGSYRVYSPMLERRVQITRWDLDAAVQKFQRALETSGVGPELQRRGIQPGDMVHIGEYELEWGE
jgi:GTP-binding protein